MPRVLPFSRTSSHDAAFLTDRSALCVPARMLVIGGGYIGLEMGTVYASLGASVSVVELTDGLLPGADRDLVKPLEKQLRKLFKDQTSN